MKILKAIVLLFLSCGTVCAQAPLRSGKPVMSSDPEGVAPLGVLQAIASQPVGSAYLRTSDSNPSVFLLAKVGTPGARGLYFATMEGIRKPGGELVFGRPVKVKAFWGKPKNMPVYGCVFNYKGGVLSLWAESQESLTLASFDPDTRELSKIASIPVEGLAGVHSISAVELADGTLDVTAIAGDGSRYRTDRAKDESWYDGAMIYKGCIAKGGLRTMILKDPARGGSFKDASPASFMIAPTGVARICDPFMGADGYLVVNRFGVFTWQEAASAKSPRCRVLDESGDKVVYQANGAHMTLLSLRSGERIAIMGGEGALVSCRFEGMGLQGPILSQPRTVLERGGALYTGTLGVPEVVDWDGDGKLDIVVGNSEGRIQLFRNTGTNAQPAFSSFAEPLLCDGEPVCIRPGYLGVQGPFEAVWGYMCPSIFDWNGDGHPDIVFSNAMGKLEVMLNTGAPSGMELRRPYALCEDGLEIKGLWRVKPAVAEIGGKVCVVNLDGEGALHRWWKEDEMSLTDGGQLLLKNGKPITAHPASAGRDGVIGRVKINLYDWDGDGDLDLILGTPQTSSLPRPDKGLPNGFVLKQLMLQVFYMENVGNDENPRFADPVGFRVKGEDLNLGVHANAPEPCLLGDVSNGANLLVGCESGRLFWIDRKDLSTFTIKERYDKK